MECDCLEYDEGNTVQTREGDIVCRQCGRVVESHVLDMRPEWYDAESSRVGGVGRDDFLLGGTSRSTVPPNKRRLAPPDPHKHVKMGLREIERLIGKFHLDPECTVSSAAKEMYRDYSDARQSENRTIRETERTAAAAVALYYGFKCEQYPRTVKEMSGMCDVGLKQLDKLLKDFLKLLVGKPYFKKMLATVHAKDVVIRVLNHIDFKTEADKNKVLKRAREMFETVSNASILDGHTPDTVCGAVLYRTVQELGISISKKNIFAACNVSSVTLSKALTRLNEHIEQRI